MNENIDEKLDIIKGHLAQGYHLIPLHHPTVDGCSCYRGAECPYGSRGKHPLETDWSQCANHVKTFEQALNVWGEAGNPKWNVGVPTGQCSGIVVVDIDPDNGGADSLERLCDDIGYDLTLTRTYRTGSGGVHLVFAYPMGTHITNSNKNLKKTYPGVDIRGNGGQIVIYPSQSAKGAYSLQSDNPMLPLPQKFIDLIQTPESIDRNRVDRSTLKDRSELPEDLQKQCDAYARRGVDLEMHRFTSEYNEPNWDDLVNDVSFTCFMLANSPWNDLEVADIEEALMEKAPRGGDNDWTESRIDKCINSAWNAVERRDLVRKLPESVQSKLDDIQRATATDWDAQVVDVNGLAEYFTLDYLVEDYLPTNSVCRLFGDSGSFKSFIVLDMAARISLGESWYGHQTKKGKVLYIAAEGEQGMYKRALGWQQHYGKDMYVKFLPKRLQVEPGGEQWKSFIGWCAREQFSLIIFDTQAKTTIGVEENSNTDFGRIVEEWEKLREATKACVLIIHHTGLSNKDRSRGNSATKAALQTELRVDREEKTRYVQIVSPKQKDDDDSVSVRLMMEKLDVDGLQAKSGKAVTTLVATLGYTVRGNTISKHPLLNGKTADFKRSVVALITQMDNEGMPSDTGAPAVLARLTDWSISAGKDKVALAVKIRKSMATDTETE